jgi:hypothetical protein
MDSFVRMSESKRFSCTLAEETTEGVRMATSSTPLPGRVTQCAAVKTIWGLINVPPHVWAPFEFLRDARNGYSAASTC